MSGISTLRKSTGGGGSRHPSGRPDRRSLGERLAQGFGANTPYWLALALLVMVFAIGGGARGDIASLAALRPAALVLLGIGLATLQTAQIRQYRVPFAVLLAAVGLVLFQLIPLPPALWHALPGHAIVAEIDRTAGLPDVWRPMTMTPSATRNALWSFAPPLAMLAIGAQLSEEQRLRLLGPLLAIGAASSLLALLQMLGGAQGPFYLYRETNYGSGVGLFANRNHQATLLACLIPALAVWAQTARKPRSHDGASRGGAGPEKAASRLTAALLAGAFLVPLVLVTGSRWGVVQAAIALVSLALLRKRGSRTQAGVKRPPDRVLRILPLLLAGVFALLAAVTVLSGKAESLLRLFAQGPAEDMRFRMAPVLFDMVKTYLPWGSGYGSFETLFQIHEPEALLAPTIMNHAHDDWLEIALTGGLPAIALTMTALACIAMRALRALQAPADRPARLAARLGLILFILLGLASLTDYPLRVPSLACLAVLAAIWLYAPVNSSESRKTAST